MKKTCAFSIPYYSNNMFRVFFRVFPVLLAVLFFSVASACSRIVYKTAYRSADSLILGRIDKYFDLDSSQENFLSQRLHEHLVWHKRNEMPRYEIFLSEFRSRVSDGLTPVEVDWLYANFRTARVDLMNQIKPDTIDFLSTITPEQISHLENQFPDLNKELEETVALTPSERNDIRYKKLLESTSEWTGDLSENQRQRVQEVASRMPDFPPAQLQFRKIREKEVIDLLKSRPGRREIESKVNLWLVNVEAGYPAEYRRTVEQWNVQMKRLILDIDGSLSPEQRRAVIGRIDGFLQDVRDLKSP